MSSMKFTLNKKGVAELMKSSEMQGVLNEKASQIVARAGAGYEQTSAVGKTRANAKVKAVTFEAKRDNKKNNTLLKAMR